MFNNPIQNIIAALLVFGALLAAGIGSTEAQDTTLPTDAQIEQMERDLRDAYEARRKAAQDAGDDAERQHWLIQRRAIELAISNREGYTPPETEPPEVETPVVDPPVVDPPVVDSPVADPPTSGGNSGGGGDGFTAFDLVDGARIIYVAADGDDDADGLSPDQALRTPRRGYEQLRSGAGDWLLFKAGDVFTSGLGSWDKRGQSEDHPILVGVYGDGDRPRFELNGESLVYASDGTHHVAFVGLEAYCPTHDPDNAAFDFELEASDAMHFVGDVSNILVEDCKIAFFSKGVVFQDVNEARIHDLTVRRCIIRYCWNDGDRGAGLYTNRARSVTIEENLIDHNGWHPAVGADRSGPLYSRGVQAHGCYLSGRYNSGVPKKWDEADKGDEFVVEFHRNIVSRSSANGVQFRLGGHVSDNVFYGNPMAFYVWTNPSSAHRNAILGGTHIDMDADGGFWQRGWGIQVIAEGEYSENVIANVTERTDNSHALVYEHSGAEVHGNVFYNWRAGKDRDDGAVWNKNNADLAGFAGNVDTLDGSGMVDPTRTLDDIEYHAERQRGEWDESYDAALISAWIREGYQPR